MLIDDILPDALAEVLGNVIRDVRKEWDREHELALARQSVIIANLEKRNTELQVELRDAVNAHLLLIDIKLGNIKNGEPGPQGEQGLQGIQGIPGPQGEKGEPGIPGEQGIQGIQGEKGDKGEQGNPGLMGEKGEKGETGEPGIKGEPGEQGIAGERGIQGERGEQGIKGERGDIGLQGEKGIDGINGKDGEKGIPGEKGEKGEIGIQGEKGIAGKDGVDGVGVFGGFIDRSGNLVLTLSDGKTLKLDNVIGKDGEPGKPGKSIDFVEIETAIEKSINKTLSEAEVSLLAPSDTAAIIGKGISLLAESPPVVEWKDFPVSPSQPAPSPVNLIISDQNKPRTKTITTRRDENGNLVADVVEK